MKKILAVFLAGLFLLSFGIFALAEETEETENEVAVMNTHTGAQVRLMQLEKSIARNILVGERVVENIVENNPDADVEDLNEALAELEVIKQEVQEMADTIPEDANASELAEQFVTIKAEARNISNQFRTQAQGNLGDEQRQQLRERARNLTSEEIEEKNEQIRQRIREHNAEQVQRVLQNMGKENEELVQKVRAGELNSGQAVSQVAREYRGLSEEKKQQAKAKINEQRAKRDVQKQAVMEKAKKNLKEKVQKRAQQRREKVQEKLEQVRKRIRDRLPEEAKDKFMQGANMSQNTMFNNSNDKKPGAVANNTPAGGAGQ